MKEQAPWNRRVHRAGLRAGCGAIAHTQRTFHQNSLRCLASCNLNPIRPWTMTFQRRSGGVGSPATARCAGTTSHTPRVVKPYSSRRCYCRHCT